MFIFASGASRDTTGGGVGSTMGSSSQGGGTSSRRGTNRYSRSSTTSVTQLLSDSCSNLLQRLTNRVRGPSAASSSERALLTSNSTTLPSATLSAPTTRRQRPVITSNGASSTKDDSTLGALASARSRLEQKYSSVLDRKPSFISSSGTSSRSNRRNGTETVNNSTTTAASTIVSGRHRERESSPFVRDNSRTLEPSQRRSVIKSPSSVLLSEKAYPYVSPARREKTPCGHERRTNHRSRRNAENSTSMRPNG